jgi:hypothetical protein
VRKRQPRLDGIDQIVLSLTALRAVSATLECGAVAPVENGPLSIGSGCHQADQRDQRPALPTRSEDHIWPGRPIPDLHPTRVGVNVELSADHAAEHWTNATGYFDKAIGAPWTRRQ